MIFDAQSLFSDDQAITATAASTNIIDLGAPATPKHAKAAVGQDLGRGRDVPLRVQVTETFTNLTSLTFAVQVDNDSAFGSPTTVLSVVVPLASLLAGYVLPAQYAPRGTDERYMRILYTVIGTNPGAGEITAGLVFGNDTWSA